MKLNGKGVDRAELLGDAQAWPNIQVIDGFLDDDALRSLYLSADVLLSLHRAEGFGLPMLEAMALGVPVIATAYSGNLDFMTEVTGMLVPARTVPVHDTAVYMRYADAVWADPDEAAARRRAAPAGRRSRFLRGDGTSGLSGCRSACDGLATAAGLGAQPGYHGFAAAAVRRAVAHDSAIRIKHR